MKKIKIMAPAAVLLAALALGGCGRVAAAAREPDEQTEKSAETVRETRENGAELYQIRIAELENELRQLRGANEQAQTPAATAAEASVPAEAGMTFTYRVENGTATVTGYRGDTAFVQVPAALDGYPVTKIGQRAFEGSDVTVVELPDCVREVDWFAFYGCARLLYVSLPAGVERLGYAVFDECPHVTVLCSPGSYAEQYAKSYGLSTAQQKEG